MNGRTLHPKSPGKRAVRLARILAITGLLAPSLLEAQSDTSILFIGNSFTFGAGSPVRFYRSDTVTDLNAQGIGGVPALFKSFADQAGLGYEVYVETQPGSGLEFHIENRLDRIERPWDVVVMHGQSTLDFDNPRDPSKLIATTRELSGIFQDQNPNVSVYLTATWSRADEVYPEDGAWYGEPIEAMARDVRAGYDRAAEGAPAVTSVNPVGEAWTRAMAMGVADPNPYDGIEFGRIDLWTYDHYHASTYGYYLEALVVWGNVTGRDPRSLGPHECSAYELGISQAEAGALQQVAFDELNAAGRVTAAPTDRARPERCGAPG